MKFTPTNLTKMQMREKLQAEGYVMLGSGVCATVWWHPRKPTRVIKVGGVVDTRRDGYLQYIKRLGRTVSPLAPKIFSVRYFSFCGETMIEHWDEKLRAYVSKPMQHAEKYYVIEQERLFDAKDDITRVRQIAHTQLGFEPCELYTLGAYEADKRRKNYETLIAQAKSMAAPVIGAIHGATADGRIGVDIHSGNYMFRNVRGRRQLVITDPTI